METRLTEFSYGYCVTEEFANGMGAGLKAAPYFPSLYVEGKAGGGFDVLIGSALFLQFKLCHELTRATALECKKGLLQPTFYRFWLHRKDQSDQHKMLVELEQAGNQVYYIAPGFADVDTLNRHYVMKQVVANSAMFSPLDIGSLPNNDRHRISFRPGDSTAYFMSDPRSSGYGGAPKSFLEPWITPRRQTGTASESGSGKCLEKWTRSSKNITEEGGGRSLKRQRLSHTMTTLLSGRRTWRGPILEQNCFSPPDQDNKGRATLMRHSESQPAHCAGNPLRIVRAG